jgi:hypothetical protein
MALNKLEFGLNAAIPTTAKAAWGARAIYRRGGFDLVWDRQDMQALEPDDKTALVKILNGGALEAAQKAFAKAGLSSGDSKLVTLYEGDGCTMVCNPNGSYGYVYLAAWI